MPKVGDYLIMRPIFGMGKPTLVTIESMDVTKEPREKYGRSAQRTTWDMVSQNRVVFSISNGHWCYSDQVDIKASEQAQKYMAAPLEEVVEVLGTLHPLIAQARLDPTPKETP